MTQSGAVNRPTAVLLAFTRGFQAAERKFTDARRKAEDEAIRANAESQVMVDVLKRCDHAFASWQCGQIPGRPEDILALIVDVRAALTLVGEPVSKASDGTECGSHPHVPGVESRNKRSELPDSTRETHEEQKSEHAPNCASRKCQTCGQPQGPITGSPHMFFPGKCDCKSADAGKEPGR
jgi:hypothetical protein